MPDAFTSRARPLDEHWVARAACRGLDVNQFVKAAGPKADYTAQKAICATCTVSQECLDYALERPELVGCWGGTCEKERRVLRKAVA